MFILTSTLSFLFVFAQSFSFRKHQTRKAIVIRSSHTVSVPIYSYTAADTSGVSSSPWVTVSSIKEDNIEGTNEILLKLEQSIATHNYNVGVVILSSIYEQNQYQDVVNVLREKIPKLQTLIGCTAGCVIGPSAPWLEPTEVESKASIALTLLSANYVSSFRYDDDELTTVINDTTASSSPSETGDASNKFSLILGCESSKPQFANFVEQLSKKGMMGSIVGAVASSVTALHLPKIFLAQLPSSSSSSETHSLLTLEKYDSGVVGLTLSFPSSSNIIPDSHGAEVNVQTIVARSSLPVGPVYRITERRGNEIRSMIAESDAASVAEVPLVLLDQVLTLLGSEESDALKRELLVSVGSYSAPLAKLVDYSCQRPTDFNPTEGSLVMPFLSAAATHVQFSVRDSSAARRDLLSSSLRLRRYLEASRATVGHSILSVLVLGSVERGTKVFRYSSWESAQVWRQLQCCGNLSATVPAFGLFAGAAVFSSPSKSASLMESDAVYAVISTGPQPLLSSATADWDSPLAAVGGEDIGDILTPIEAEIYSDVNDLVLVSKKDSLSSHAVRVSTMEFTVPEKQPQPGNTLESLYWERDKDLDRQRERFPLNRALLQAKLAEKKYPTRGFPALVKQQRNSRSKSGGSKPSYIVTVHRSTLNVGKLSEDVQTATLLQNIQSVSTANGVTLAAVGVQVDSSTNKGQFEDLQILRTESTLPVFCDDFVLFAYQLFRARECGADVVRLHTSATSPADMTYLIKIARTLQMTCLVTCASKPQLLAALREMPGLEAVCVTSRNMRLWKLDANKADRILADSEVQQALAQHPNAESLIVCQEGFATHPVSAALNPRVDAVLISEELLRSISGSDSSALIDNEQFVSNLHLWLS